MNRTRNWTDLIWPKVLIIEGWLLPLGKPVLVSFVILRSAWLLEPGTRSR